MSDQNRARIIWTITIALSALGFTGLLALCLTLFFRNYADPAVLTAIIAITSGVVGSLSTMAIQKPQQPQPPDGGTTNPTT